MGTPSHPESHPHFARKALQAKQLRYRLERNMRLSIVFVEHCDKCHDDPREPTIENLLRGVDRIEVEEAVGPYRPDISLWDADGNPLRVIEVVTTHKSSDAALGYYKQQGVDVFTVRAESRNDVFPADFLWIQYPSDAQVANCRAPQRKRLNELFDLLEAAGDQGCLGVKQFYDSDRDWEKDLGDRWVTQEFQVAGRTVTREDFLNLVERIRFNLSLVPIPSTTDETRPHVYNSNDQSMLHTLQEILAVVRHQNGNNKPEKQRVSFAEWPIGNELLYESQRSSLDSICFRYGRYKAIGIEGMPEGKEAILRFTQRFRQNCCLMTKAEIEQLERHLLAADRWHARKDEKPRQPLIPTNRTLARNYMVEYYHGPQAVPTACSERLADIGIVREHVLPIRPPVNGIDATGNCLAWLGRLNGEGYALWAGEHAHVAAFKEAGRVADSTESIRHFCRIPFCVQPAHLYAGDPLQREKTQVPGGFQPVSFSHHEQVMGAVMEAAAYGWSDPEFKEVPWSTKRLDQLKCPGHEYTIPAGDISICWICNADSGSEMIVSHNRVKRYVVPT